MPSSSLSSFPSGQSWLSFLVLYLSIPNATTESICSKDILSRGFNQLTPTSPSSTFQSTSHFSGDLRLPYSRLYQCHETKEDGLLYLTKAHTPKCRKVDHVSDDLINQDHSNEDKKSVINCLHESHEHEAAHHHRGDALTRGSILQCDIFWDNDQKNIITNYVGRRSSDSWLHPRTTQSNNITITSFAISCLKQGSFPPALRLQKAFERKTYASLNGDDVATHIARPTIKEYSKAQARGHLFPSGRPPSPYALVKSPDQINEVASKHVNTHGLIDLVQESFTSSSAGILSQRTREEVAITAIILWTIFIFLWM